MVTRYLCFKCVHFGFASISVRLLQDGRTALMYAASTGKPLAVEMLLEKKAKTHFETKVITLERADLLEYCKCYCILQWRGKVN